MAHRRFYYAFMIDGRRLYGNSTRLFYRQNGELCDQELQTDPKHFGDFMDNALASADNPYAIPAMCNTTWRMMLSLLPPFTDEVTEWLSRSYCELDYGNLVTKAPLMQLVQEKLPLSEAPAAYRTRGGDCPLRGELRFNNNAANTRLRTHLADPYRRLLALAQACDLTGPHITRIKAEDSARILLGDEASGGGRFYGWIIVEGEDGVDR